MTLYPSIHSAVLSNLIEKIPHKSNAVENQYVYYKMVFDVARLCPETEEKILEAITERLCQIDVDIKNKVRKF